MPNKKQSQGLIMQAGILAAAGIIVRIIGLLYNSPMTAILGDEGIGSIIRLTMRIPLSF